ncbi:unnamed protein product [Ectocarpus sp. 8 AP-2014]
MVERAETVLAADNGTRISAAAAASTAPAYTVTAPATELPGDVHDRRSGGRTRQASYPSLAPRSDSGASSSSSKSAIAARASEWKRRIQERGLGAKAEEIASFRHNTNLSRGVGSVTSSRIAAVSDFCPSTQGPTCSAQDQEERQQQRRRWQQQQSVYVGSSRAMATPPDLRSPPAAHVSAPERGLKAWGGGGSSEDTARAASAPEYADGGRTTQQSLLTWNRNRNHQHHENRHQPSQQEQNQQHRDREAEMSGRRTRHPPNMDFGGVGGTFKSVDSSIDGSRTSPLISFSSSASTRRGGIDVTCGSGGSGGGEDDSSGGSGDGDGNSGSSGGGQGISSCPGSGSDSFGDGMRSRDCTGGSIGRMDGVGWDARMGRDIATGTARPQFPATGASEGTGDDAHGNGDSVLLGPTFCPPASESSPGSFAFSHVAGETEAERAWR